MGISGGLSGVHGHGSSASDEVQACNSGSLSAWHAGLRSASVLQPLRVPAADVQTPGYGRA
jgi:hypothetical protein